MPLLDQVQSVSARLKKAEAARTGLEEAQALDELKQALSAKHEVLESLIVRARMLNQNRVTVSPPSGLTPYRERIEKLAGQFRDAPIAATLRTGRRWTGLMDALDTLCDAVGAAQAEGWQNYFRTKLFAGSAPATVKARLAVTPKNTVALTRYTQLFNAFTAYRSRIPELQSDFDRLHDCSDELAKISFDENVPSDVANFFAATASSTGASLELLTSEVLRWLQDNGLLGKYVVRARVD